MALWTGARETCLCYYNIVFWVHRCSDPDLANILANRCLCTVIYPLPRKILSVVGRYMAFGVFVTTRKHVTVVVLFSLSLASDAYWNGKNSLRKEQNYLTVCITESDSPAQIRYGSVNAYF